jgi:hypothetical protein
MALLVKEEINLREEVEEEVEVEKQQSLNRLIFYCSFQSSNFEDMIITFLFQNLFLFV